MRLQRQKNAKSEVMVVGTDAPVVVGVPLSLCADVRKHLKEFCLLISVLPGSKGKKK